MVNPVRPARPPAGRERFSSAAADSDRDEEAAMGDTGCAGPALRVERGTASEEDLAALTAVLLALRARPARQPPDRPARGPHWGHRPAGYQGWRAGPAG
ncbi:acyl-CoA carboxylase epsilon subunit [Streptomyces sp. NPDC101225]|uniref:acyl-CoA carboxylase epsilon subunit n=1 Tax=Streptomyces sp. NPDC101225 TaxID=3366135 RepID=UPI00380B572A